MGNNIAQFSLNMGGNFVPTRAKEELRDIIVDRKSKYTLVVIKISDMEDVKKYFKELKEDSYFAKATHNSYAYRIEQENGSVIEGKNDDGEQGAGMCILRELQRASAINTMMIVTRYFGGIQLHTDRFKNVIEACKIYFEAQK